MKSSVIFDQLGGEAAIWQLVTTFYDIIESHPDGRNIRRLHMNGHGMLHAREEQFNFLCGFTGGPQHYLQKHRHANVRQMHAHVPIRQEDAINWLTCMDLAMKATNVDAEIAAILGKAFTRIAHSLINDVKG